MDVQFTIELKVFVENPKLKTILKVFKEVLPSILNQLFNVILLVFSESYMGMQEKPICCDKCGNNRSFIWKTRHGRGTIIKSIFCVLMLKQLQWQCKKCHHKFFITRKLLGVEPGKTIPTETNQMLGLIGALASFRVSEKIVSMFGWALNKMTVWRAVQVTGKEIEFDLDPNELPQAEADGTGIPIKGIHKRGKEMKVIVQLKKGGGVRIAGLAIGNYDKGWDKLFAPLIRTMKSFKEFVLVTDGDTSILKGLKGKIEIIVQRCLWHIPHQLKYTLWKDKAILHKWLKCGVLENNSFILTDKGTPQGGIISPCLMNLTLDGLEQEIRKLSSRNNPEKINFVRYADDWIVTGSDKVILEKRVKPIAEQFLAERGLRLSPEKTHITQIDQGFDFLGQNVRKYGAKLLITPSKKNIKTFLEKVRATIRENNGAKQEALIRLLNPVIRGWANYHRCIVAKRIFSHVDNEIWKALRQWENRRHPHKSIRWIRHKYRRRIGNWGNVFSCHSDEGKLLTLFNASSVPIQRHVKIRGKANPFDPEWDSYFEKRGYWKIQRNLSGQKRLLAIWHRQKGKCPICSSLLTEREEFDVHHILPRSQGGTNLASNLALLHPNCHNQVHHPLSNVGFRLKRLIKA